MRSTKLDQLEPEVYLLQARIGCDVINSVYQPDGSNHPQPPPPEDITDDTREEYIRSKYVDKVFAREDSPVPAERHSQLLIEACEGDYIPKMLYHMVHGADVNYTDPKTGISPAHAAAMKGFALALAFLALNGADLNCKDSAGCTPLHYAAERNFAPAVAMLLKYGADPEATNNEGVRPRDVVVASHEIKVLLKEGHSKKDEKIVLGEFFGDLESSILEQRKKPTGLKKTPPWVSASPKSKTVSLSQTNDSLSN